MLFSSSVLSVNTKDPVLCSFSKYLNSDVHLSPREIMDVNFQNKFVKISNKLGEGYTSKHLWVKAECSNIDTQHLRIFFEIDYPMLQLVDVYSSNQSIPDYSLGRRFRVSSVLEPIDNRYPLVLIKFEPSETKTIFFHIASQGPVIGKINVYPSKEYMEQDSSSKLAAGIYFGLFVANIILVIFLIISAIASRQSAHLSLFFIYLFYVIANTLYQFSYAGFSHLYLWSENSTLNYRSVVTISPILLAFLNEYSRRFINFSTTSPKWNIVLLMVTILNLFLIPFCFLADFTTVSKTISYIGFSMFIFYFIFSFYLVTKRTENSLLYFLGWSSYLAGMAVLILRNFNVLPFNFFTKHSQEIGTLVEMTFFSISLVNRIRIRNQQLVKEAAVTQTTMAVSHEIRRPFKVVLSELKHLRVKYPQLAKELTEKIEPVVNSAFERLNNILDELRIINESSSDRYQEKVNLLETAEEAAKNIKGCFPEFSGEISICGVPIEITGQKANFLKIYENIFENAIESGGLGTSISFEISRKLFGGIKIRIKNTGSVIPNSLGEDIFKLHFTTKDKGHGVGLALCKKLVSDFNGSIDAFSNSEEKSTTFLISLPQWGRRFHILREQ